MPALRKIDEQHRHREQRSPTPTVRRDFQPSAKSPPQGIRRIVFLALAGMFFAVAALGAILPGLPCTPFVLLTSYFLLRSSPRMNERLLRSRWFGPLLRDWQERGGVARHVKVKSILLVAIVVGLTLYFGGLSSVLMGIVSGLALIGMLIIARLPAPRN